MRSESVLVANMVAEFVALRRGVPLAVNERGGVFVNSGDLERETNAVFVRI